MTIASSGSVSMSTVNTELGLTSTASITLNDTLVRRLAQKSSGAVSLNDCRGKKYASITSGYLVKYYIGADDYYYGYGKNLGLDSDITFGSFNPDTPLNVNGKLLRGVYATKPSDTPNVSTVFVVFDTYDVPDSVWETVTVTSSTGSKTYNRSDAGWSLSYVSGNEYKAWYFLFNTAAEFDYWEQHFGNGTHLDVVFTLP